MTEHPDATELEQFVRGQLDDGPRQRFEAHLGSCGACAAALAREARLELALVELATVEAACPAAPRPSVARRRSLQLAAAAAAIALLILAIRTGTAPPGAIARTSPNVTCPAGAAQAACVRSAHRHGLFVQYPGWAGPPPLGAIAPDDGVREVVDPDRRLADGPSRPPFTLTDPAAP